MLCGLLLRPVTAQMTPEAPVEDFTLTDHRGEPFSLSDARGTLVMLSFGYSFCPDVCPLTLAGYARVLEDLGERAESVTPLFVSLDPRRDTPEVLAPYVGYFHPAIIGLTGEEGRLKEIVRRFGGTFAYRGDTDGGRYTLDHPANLYLLDPQGRLTAIVPFGLPPGHILQRIRELLP